ncbi:GET complex, subunit GET2 [Purpureocillium lilacinum]|uniref:GET complex, subunit GET2 n=1 Tax=Purpureocillium lilacinum TaxID=33203 RepID=A0A179HE50_PURLI|nr:GET complex, subunit GET2 [Purpureocillium lilacinum]OAQ88497.1 GET complex, subunit GET2 [Purpureocillium lilacinum]
MADSSAAATSNDADAAAQRASEQARLRKERREAKLKAGGSARLNKITGIGGRVASAIFTPPATEDAASPKARSVSATQAPAQQHHAADPEEVDISEHFYEPRTTTPSRRNVSAAAGGGGAEPSISDAQLRQMMLGFDRPGQSASPSPSPGPGPGGPALPPGMEDDPLMKMMSQMMGGAGMPGMPGMPGQQQQQAARPDAYTTFFRILHALLALGLGLYVTLLTPFSGTRLERERASLAHAAHVAHPNDDLAAAALDDANERRKLMFFWIFATGEAVLLTTRFFLDKGRRQQPAGMLWSIAGFVPEPFRGYLLVALRYGQIFTTVRADILACMFVLGVCSWWKS